MRRFFVFLGVVLWAIGSVVSAQEVDSMAPLQKSSWGDAKKTDVSEYIPAVSLGMRAGYVQDFSENAGRFCGDGIYLDVNGKINSSFSYSWNQTLASRYFDVSGFDGTNWLTLTYEVDDFAFTAGKDGLLIGSFEYDTADIDSYYEMNSLFYNEIDCWQRGVSAAWYPSDSHEFLIQAANSPYSYGVPNLFAYAAAWRGYWDRYESYWTANLWQEDKSQFVKSLNFGNRFYLRNLTVDMDILTRFTQGQTFYTGLIKPAYEWVWGRAFAKIGLENITDDYSPESMSHYLFYGAGMEFFPLKENKDVRVHAIWASNNEQFNLINIGLTWRINFKSDN